MVPPYVDETIVKGELFVTLDGVSVLGGAKFVEDPGNECR